MKAIVLTGTSGPKTLEYREIPDPVPGPDDLLVRVRASALNRSDVLQRRGGYPQPGNQPEFEVPGLEFAGEVVEVGRNVVGFAPGDRVMALVAGGGYAEMALVNWRHAVRVPEGLGWHEAGGTMEVFITAHDALRQCDLVSGESVLIHAAGSGVGTAAIQIAKSMGVSLVIGTAGSRDKLDRAHGLGMDVGVNYREQDFAEVVKSATNGRGVDAILDVIGADYWDRNLQSLALKGRMVLVGMMGGSTVNANLGQMLGKRLQVRGTVLRARSPEEKGYAVRAFEKSVAPHIASGAIRVIIDRVFPLEQAAEAQAHMEANANFGKIILQP